MIRNPPVCVQIFLDRIEQDQSERNAETLRKAELVRRWKLEDEEKGSVWDD